jgi:hypothetical protein
LIEESYVQTISGRVAQFGIGRLTRRFVFCAESGRVNRSVGNGEPVVDCTSNRGCTPLATVKVGANKQRDIRQNGLVSLDMIDLASYYLFRFIHSKSFFSNSAGSSNIG